jgi:diamine N-acetyltransferase
LKLTLRRCTIDDLITLREIAYNTYKDTFEHWNTQANMKAYLEKSFAVEKIRGELTNAGSLFYFLYTGKKLAGYMKLNECEAQSDIHDPDSLEIERIYITRTFQGKGLGKFLLEQAVEVALARNKSSVWLGV